VTGLGPSSRANARDLRKISPFGRNDTAGSLRAWRPFDVTQDCLGAINSWFELSSDFELRISHFYPKITFFPVLDQSPIYKRPESVLWLIKICSHKEERVYV
jgi:hypothetical protein